MCAEFLLAFLYFLTLFIINIFLYRLIFSYFKKLLFFLKIKMIFSSLKKNNNNSFANYYFFFQKIKKSSFEPNFFSIIKTNDILLIGNFYNLLLKNGLQQNRNSFDYYYSLLSLQYLISNN
uniref:Uncharacterized protein n=1 Tax=Neotessella volvocina TaxID=52559 RepID=A0A3G2QZU7_9STRA|nr:hypothetical protein [Neotessella volvocina]